MEIAKKIDLSEISWPAAVASMVICLILSIKSCANHSSTESTAREKAFIAGGCDKVAIKGSTGTHWVCEKNK